MTLTVLPPAIREIAHLLRHLDVPWAIAGGWAIDLALGSVTRPHADVDVAIFRADQDAIRAALPAWEFRLAMDGALVPWGAGVWLAPPVHEVHARRTDGGAAPTLEFLLDERDGAEWVYRRDPLVRRPVARVLRVGPAGIRVLAPEVVLLYKSKAPRPTDEHDLAVARPLLDAEARSWLGAALRRQRADHPWASVLGLES